MVFAATVVLRVVVFAVMVVLRVVGGSVPHCAVVVAIFVSLQANVFDSLAVPSGVVHQPQKASRPQASGGCSHDMFSYL